MGTRIAVFTRHRKLRTSKRSTLALVEHYKWLENDSESRSRWFWFDYYRGTQFDKSLPGKAR